MQVQATVDPHLAALIARYEATPRTLDTAVRIATMELGAKMKAETVGREGLSKFARRKPEVPTPSRAGVDPPGQVTGKLRQSVTQSKAQRQGFAVYSTKVGPTIKYGRIQELGGRTGRGGRTLLPPRPYLLPAARRVSRYAHRIYTHRIIAVFIARQAAGNGN
jgi:phage gpG-like protein